MRENMFIVHIVGSEITNGKETIASWPILANFIAKVQYPLFNNDMKQNKTEEHMTYCAFYYSSLLWLK